MHTGCFVPCLCIFACFFFVCGWKYSTVSAAERKEEDVRSQMRPFFGHIWLCSAHRSRDCVWFCRIWRYICVICILSIVFVVFLNGWFSVCAAEALRRHHWSTRRSIKEHLWDIFIHSRCEFVQNRMSINSLLCVIAETRSFIRECICWWVLKAVCGVSRRERVQWMRSGSAECAVWLCVWKWMSGDPSAGYLTCR